MIIVNGRVTKKQNKNNLEVTVLIFKDILKQLSEKGYSSYRLQREGPISNGTLMQIRKGKPITTTTIEQLCTLLDCQPNDLMEHVKEDQAQT